MEITLTFLVVVMAHFLLTALSFRTGIVVLLFLFPIYPRFLSVGISTEGFALSGQRAMLYVLFGFYVLRVLWGSADVWRGIEIAKQYRRIIYPILILIGARLAGNVITSRIDLGSIAAMVNETLISIFAVMLILTFVKKRQDIVTLLTIIAASVVVNQVAASVEFSMGEPLLPTSIELQFETARDADSLQEGRTRDANYRAMAFFDNPLKLAGFLTMAIPLVIALIRISPSLIGRGFGSLSVAMAFPVALFCGSRTALGALLIMACWYLYLGITKGMTRLGRRFMGTMVGLLGIALITVVGSGLIEQLFFGETFGRSTESRYLQFLLVPLAMLGSPVFGYGFARNIIEVVSGVGSLDSYFLQMGLEGGAVALIAVLTAIYQAGKILRNIKSSAQDAWTRNIATGLNVSLALASLISLVLSLGQIRVYIFLVIGMAIAMDNLLKSEDKVPMGKYSSTEESAAAVQKAPSGDG